MKSVKIISVFICVALLFSLCGCKENPAEEGGISNAESSVSRADSGKLQLLYSYSDTFNPYTASTELNRRLCALLFDPLVKCDNNLEPVYCVAGVAAVDGKECTVRLNSVSFSDGSPLTADDVVYSYNLARDSATAYAHRFYEVASVRATAKDTVVFSLNRNDPYFVRLLDFPIIKAGSEKLANSDGVAAVPIGSGRYTVNEERNGLVVNKSHFEYSGQLADIELINAPDSDAVSHYVEVGAADVYYSAAAGSDIVRMSGKKTDVNLNNLVYIGINSASTDLKNKNMRYAISSALDRAAICNQSYFNNAVAATGFYSPVFKAAASRQTLEKNTNLEITIENLEKIGYNRLNDDGYRVNQAGKHPTFSLLVNSDNASRLAAAELIAQQLKSAGIEIRVVSQPFEQYKATLESGSYQLYLGEVSFQNNMDISPLVVAGGSAAFGVGAAEATTDEDNDGDLASQNEAPAVSYSEMLSMLYAGDEGITVGDIAGALLTEMPQIPVCYRLGLVFYDSHDVNCEDASAGDIYFNIRKSSAK